MLFIYRYFISAFIFIIYFKNINTKVINIRNNESSFYNIFNIFNNLDTDLTINFVDSYYDMTKINFYKIYVNVNSNISFVGCSNGTVFDYKREKDKISLNIDFKGTKNKLVTIENIYFINFDPRGQNTFAMHFLMDNNDNKVIINNCTFQDNYYDLIFFNLISDNLSISEPQFIFNNCNFYNNKQKIIYTYHIIKNKNNDLYKCYAIKMVNCNFINNNGLFFIHFMRFICENCYFSKINQSQNTNENELPFTLLYTSASINFISFKNTTFEDINISKLPLIDSNGLILEIEDSRFSNCVTDNGYLISIKQQYNNQYVKIKNSIFINISTLFNGNLKLVSISNSIFKDLKIKNLLPTIASSKYTKFVIENTEFYNLNLSNSLFEEESEYSFTNVTFKNIITNSNALIKCNHNDISFTNVEVDNVICAGDSDDSSLILFNSEYTNNKILHLNNIKITNSKSNGSFIKIVGDTNIFVIENSIINNIISYGPIIENSSLMSKIIMSNNNFINNINNSKYNCGNIQFNNNLDISISTSNFSNNIIKSNGGAICIKNILYMKLNLTSNLFNYNSALNGGALFLKDGINNSNNNNRSDEISIENNMFYHNHAKNFGGAIYSEYSKLYLATTKNNTIINNSADNMGGGIFTPSSINKTMFNLNNLEIHNNTVNSYNNDYSSKPKYIKLKTYFNENRVNIITGDYLNINFILYDEYDNIMVDKAKLYSFITIKLLLKPKERNTIYNDDDILFNTTSKYYMKGNIGTFVNGECNFKNLRIFAKKDTYILIVKIENNVDNIDLLFEDIEINVSNCNENQIKFHYNHKNEDVYYCENPLCRASCPVDISAKCMPNPKITKSINNIDYNMCICLKGWKGDNCDEMVFVDYIKIKRTSLVLFIPIFIPVIYIIFIVYNRKQKIIRDIGYFRILYFSFGYIIYFISNLFIAYNDFPVCSLNFLFKHFGILSVLLIHYINIIMSLKLGLKKQNNSKFKFYEKGSNNNQSINLSKPSSQIYEKENHNEYNIRRNTINENSNTIRERDITFFNESNLLTESSLSYNNEIKTYHKKIKAVHSLFLDINYRTNTNIKNNQNFQQSKNGYWYYKCSLEKPDLFLNLLYLISFVIILFLSNSFSNYECIFKFIQYIIYSNYIAVAMGPIINIINSITLKDQQNTKIIIDTILNTLCYLSIFVLNSWDKIYYILRKDGNNTNIYFIYKRHDLCLIHHSTTCGCKLNISKETFETNYNNYINLYKTCLKFHIVNIDRNISNMNN